MAEMQYFEELKASLEEAVAYKKGDKSRCRTVVAPKALPAYTAADVTRTRTALNLSQKGLALALGVSPRTVEAWEAGKNVPSGAAQRLLYLLEQDHSLIDRLVIQYRITPRVLRPAAFFIPYPKIQKALLYSQKPAVLRF